MFFNADGDLIFDSVRKFELESKGDCLFFFVLMGKDSIPLRTKSKQMKYFLAVTVTVILHPLTVVYI